MDGELQRIVSTIRTYTSGLRYKNRFLLRFLSLANLNKNSMDYNESMHTHTHTPTLSTHTERVEELTDALCPEYYKS